MGEVDARSFRKDRREAHLRLDFRRWQRFLSWILARIFRGRRAHTKSEGRNFRINDPRRHRSSTATTDSLIRFRLARHLSPRGRRVLQPKLPRNLDADVVWRNGVTNENRIRMAAC